MWNTSSSARASIGMRSDTGTWLRLAGLGLVLGGGLIVLLLVPLPTTAQVDAWAAGGGVWVPALFVVGYAAATLLLLPKNVLSAAAGLVFGLGVGLVLVWVAAMLGAAASFWLGRRLGRDGVQRLAGRHLARLDALVLRHGVLAVLVARLVPVVPFTAVNYGSGLTGVGFRAYLLATAIGIVPGTVAYVAVGAYGTDPASWPFLAATGVLLGLTAAGAWWSRRQARSATALPPPPAPAGPTDLEQEH